jgi:hypothetical protein
MPELGCSAKDKQSFQIRLIPQSRKTKTLVLFTITIIAAPSEKHMKHGHTLEWAQYFNTKSYGSYSNSSALQRY